MRNHVMQGGCLMPMLRVIGLLLAVEVVAQVWMVGR